MNLKSKSLISILFLTLILFSSTSCNRKDDVECDNATLCIKNTSSTNVVYYGWGTNYVTDTLLPGECAIRENFHVSIKHDIFGSETERSVSLQPFYCGFTTYFEVSECYTEYTVPCSGVNLKADCDNGVFNPESGEQEIDCGGNCQPCGPFSPNCFLTENVITSPLLLTNSNEKWGVVSYGHIGGDYGLEFHFKSVDNRLSFSFMLEDFPTESRMFEIGDKSHQIKMYYKSSIWNTSSWAATDGQKLYLIKKDSENWRLEFCDISLRNNENFRTENISGSLLFELSDF